MGEAIAMEDAAIWGAILLGGSSVLAWVKFWMDQGKFQARVDSANSLALAAHSETVIIKSRLHDFEVRVAQDYATHKTMIIVEERMNTMVQEFRRDVRALSERIDRVLDNRGDND